MTEDKKKSEKNSDSSDETSNETGNDPRSEAKIQLDFLLSMVDEDDHQKRSDITLMCAAKGFEETYNRVTDLDFEGGDERIYVTPEKFKEKTIFGYLLKEFQNGLSNDPETDYSVEIDDVVDDDLLEGLVNLDAEKMAEISTSPIAKKESSLDPDYSANPLVNGEKSWAEYFSEEPELRKVEVLDESRLNNILTYTDKEGIDKTAKEYASRIEEAIKEYASRVEEGIDKTAKEYASIVDSPFEEIGPWYPHRPNSCHQV